MIRPGPDIEDALNPRMVGTTEGMTLQVLAQIRDNLSAMSRDIRTNNEATADVRERVIRLEERDRRLEDIEASSKDHNARLDILEQDKLRREGAIGFMKMLKEWGPVVFSLLCALWLYGRSLGVTPVPPTNTPTIEHRIDGK